MNVSLTANEGLGTCIVALFLHIRTLRFLELYILVFDRATHGLVGVRPYPRSTTIRASSTTRVVPSRSVSTPC